MAEYFSNWYGDISFIVAGMLLNMEYTFISVFLGLIIALVLAISKTSKNKYAIILADAYTSFFRGTPLMIQLSLIYYVLPSLIGVKISVFTAAIMSFSLNSGAYVSEILRGGINSVEKGQVEAAFSLGIPKHLIMKDIVFPQAFRKILPSLINEFINMLKETSLISIIGEAEILRRAQMVASQKYNYIVPMVTAAISYYIVVLILVWVANKVERKLMIL
jgi:His/Glu/Gln/Arg/opine family amino acid ABC transporter permease subunit